jgi:hypothetical protein
LIGLTIQVQTSVEINSELPGVRTSRRYTSTLLTEGYLYNFTYWDSSLRSKTNYLLKHEDRRT